MTYAEDALAVTIAAMPEEIDPELAKLYALLVLTKGYRTTMSDVHDAWALWAGEHRSAIPYDQLSKSVQELDRPFLDAIHLAEARLSSSPTPGRASGPSEVEGPGVELTAAPGP